jgi:hypothetical protein
MTKILKTQTLEEKIQNCESLALETPTFTPAFTSKLGFKSHITPMELSLDGNLLVIPLLTASNRIEPDK